MGEPLVLIAQSTIQLNGAELVGTRHIPIDQLHIPTVGASYKQVNLISNCKVLRGFERLSILEKQVKGARQWEFI